MKSQAYIECEESLGAHNYKPLDVVLSRGQGVWVWDVEGRRYLDCLSAYSSLNQGHCHPTILKALTQQAQELTITSRAFRNNRLAEFYQKLTRVTGARKVLPMNTGVEAVETALKTARKWGYEVRGVPKDKAEIIVCENNFHGRTLGVVSFSTDPNTTNGFGPFLPGFKTIPFSDIRALKEAITPHTVAFLVEPIQGEAGVLIPSPGYFQEVRALCTEHNMALILDEIQTGLGRTGTMLAAEHEGIQPDLTLVGKALSGGFYPVSAVLAYGDMLDVFEPGQHGSTFGGNPLACAVACAALSVLLDENMVENAQKQGSYMLDRLSSLRSPHIKEVRGRGLMMALELHASAGPALPLCQALQKEGLLVKDTHEHTLRITPPLLITREEADWALERLEAVLGG